MRNLRAEAFVPFHSVSSSSYLTHLLGYRAVHRHSEVRDIDQVEWRRAAAALENISINAKMGIFKGKSRTPDRLNDLMGMELTGLETKFVWLQAQSKQGSL
jgi:hypothetical protein